MTEPTDNDTESLDDYSFDSIAEENAHRAAAALREAGYEAVLTGYPDAGDQEPKGYGGRYYVSVQKGDYTYNAQWNDSQPDGGYGFSGTSHAAGTNGLGTSAQGGTDEELRAALNGVIGKGR